MVLLNTFPISIMNHLLLIIPVQPGGGGLLSYSAMGCVSASVRNAAVCVCLCVQHLPKAPNQGMDRAHVTDREQVV